MHFFINGCREIARNIGNTAIRSIGAVIIIILFRNPFLVDFENQRLRSENGGHDLYVYAIDTYAASKSTMDTWLTEISSRAQRE